MALCLCTPALLLEHKGHAPGCRFYVAPAAPPPAALTPIARGSDKYSIARACELLVRARTHLPEDLALEVSAFLHPDPAPPAAPTPAPPAPDTPVEALPLDAPALDAFSRMPGSHAGERRQTGPVMPTPPPPAPGFTFPSAARRRAPPYSNGCAHPPTRLVQNGFAAKCLDCDSDFPNFRVYE